MNQKALITLLVLILLLVVGSAAAALYFLPLQPSSKTVKPTTTVLPSKGPAASNDTPFSTSVLNRSDYKTLDQKLIQQGSIPVQPPQGTGKANPFL